MPEDVFATIIFLQSCQDINGFSRGSLSVRPFPFFIALEIQIFASDAISTVTSGFFFSPEVF
jgi:hypothetical protein